MVEFELEKGLTTSWQRSGLIFVVFMLTLVTESFTITSVNYLVQGFKLLTGLCFV